MTRANPIKLNRPINMVELDVHRHPDCSDYEKCLDKAVYKRWRGFSCLKCTFFRKYKKIRKRLDQLYGKGGI